jgi:hypothetical protein
MKKLLFILTIATIGCSTEKDKGCKCDAHYYIEGGSSNGFTVPNTPIDCDSGVPLGNYQGNAWFTGCSNRK